METLEIKTVLREVTPQHAMELLSRNGINRPLDEKLVNKYYHEMLVGQWKITGESVKIDKQGRLIDGQHRLNAIIKYGKPIKLLLMYGLDTDVFPCLDTGKGRTAGDVLGINGIPNSRVIASIIKVYMVKRDTKQTSSFFAKEPIAVYSRSVYITNIDILNEYNKDPEFWQEMFKESTKCYRHMSIMTTATTGGIMAYLILVKENEKSVVFDFFEQIFGLKFDEYPITKKFREVMIRNKIASRKLPSLTKYVYLTKTWNFYIKKSSKCYLQFDIDKESPPEFL